MDEPSILSNLPGGKALIDWFGGAPHFHDANLLEISLSSNRPSALRIHAWVMTDEVDSQGYFVLDKHVVVTINLDQITDIALEHFYLPGIIFELSITTVDDAYLLSWKGSYGVEGSITAKKISFDLIPGKP